MTAFLLRRLAVSTLLVLLVLTATFALLHVVPGEPGLLFEDPRVPREQLDHLRQLYGLDRPLGQRYVSWLRAVTWEGDWGTSFVHQRPVTQVVARAVPPTLLLAGTALALQFLLGTLLGVWAARRRGRPADHLLRVAALFLYALPTFWVALLAVLLLTELWPLFPASHMARVGASELPTGVRLLDRLHHLVLPVAVLTLTGAGALARFSRNSLLEAISQDYVPAARARGLTESRVVWTHALRNAVVPLIQVFGLAFPVLLSGALVIEVIFSWPGMGQLAYNAILTRDTPLILAITALTGAMVVLGNLLADLLHAAVDPRVRRG